MSCQDFGRLGCICRIGLLQASMLVWGLYQTPELPFLPAIFFARSTRAISPRSSSLARTAFSRPFRVGVSDTSEKIHGIQGATRIRIAGGFVRGFCALSAFCSHCCWFLDGKVDGKKRSPLAIQDPVFLPRGKKVTERVSPRGIWTVGMLDLIAGCCGIPSALICA